TQKLILPANTLKAVEELPNLSHVMETQNVSPIHQSTTDRIPTSNSITGCIVRFPQSGANARMEIATLMPTDAATIAAIHITASEPKINGNAPSCGSFKFVGFQFLLVKNSSVLIPFTIKDCNPLIVKNAVIANVAIMSITAQEVTSNFPLNSPVTSFLLVFKS